MATGSMMVSTDVLIPMHVGDMYRRVRVAVWTGQKVYMDG